MRASKQIFGKAIAASWFVRNPRISHSNSETEIPKIYSFEKKLFFEFIQVTLTSIVQLFQ